jgi:hypothetical protein
MDASILEAQLPSSTRLPKALRLLCEFSEEIGTDFFRAGMAFLQDARDDLETWVQVAPSLGESLFAFARDATHALFACWMHETRDLEACPVVWLDSEGAGNRVVASSPSDFVWGIADGRINSGDDRPDPKLQAWLAPRLARPIRTVPLIWATDDVLEAWIKAGIAAGCVESNETH